DVTNDHTDSFGSLSFQSAGQAVASIVHLARNALHALSRFAMDIAAAVNDTRNRHRRHVSLSGNISKRNWLFWLFLHLKRDRLTLTENAYSTICSREATKYFVIF